MSKKVTPKSTGGSKVRGINESKLPKYQAPPPPPPKKDNK
jgi:hypothetical protein